MPGIPPARYAYFGPEGSFCEAALRTLPAAATADLQPHATVPSALAAVRAGEVDAALVPFENSVEGTVAVTLDELATGEPLQLTREVLLPVTLALLARPGTGLHQVHRVATHPHAAAQCRRWLASVLPDAGVLPALSTAAAARDLAAAPSTAPDAAPYDAVIAATYAATRYRLDVLADDIGDVPDAVTRFVLASRPGVPPLPTGRDRTTIAVLVAADRPGALLEILTEFAVRGVNLTRIESRPTGEKLGTYRFSFDCEGHVADSALGEALAGLHRLCAEVRFLGSYPRADEGEVTVVPGATELEFRDAAAWLARLREGRA